MGATMQDGGTRERKGCVIFSDYKQMIFLYQIYAFPPNYVASSSRKKELSPMSNETLEYQYQINVVWNWY